MKVLIVLTSHDKLGDTGNKTGFWLEEFASPYYRLKDAGAQLALASPSGGQPPLDPKSNEPDAQTEATKRFDKDPAAQKELATKLGIPASRLSSMIGCKRPATARRSSNSHLRRESTTNRFRSP